MAEKVVLISADIDTTKAVKDAQALRTEVEKLKAKTEELKKTQGETSKEYVEANAQLKATQTELRSHENILGKVVAANKANTGSISQMRAELSVVSKAWADLSKEERLNSDTGKQLAARKLELTEALKAEEKATGDTRRNVGNYTEAMQGLPGPIGAATGSVQSLIGAMKALIKIPIIAVITGIVAIFAGLIKIFKSTDSGGTELAARMDQLRAVMDVLRQRAVSLISAFKELFSGNFKKAGEEFRDTFSEIGNQINIATKAAYDYAYAVDRIKDSESNYISQSAEMRNAIARLEYTAQDRTKSTAERKKALEEAIRLGEEESKKMGEFAKDRLDNEAQYLAARSGLRKEDVLSFIRMTDEEQANASESLKTLRDNNEAKFDEIEKLYAAWLDADTKFYEENKRNISRMTGFEAELRKEQDEARQEALRLKAEREVQAARDELNAFLEITQEQTGKEAELLEQSATKKDEILARRLEAEKMNYENQLLLLEGSLFGELELERIALEQKEAQEIATAERIGANTQVIEKKYLKAKLTIARAERDAKLALAGDFMKNIATIAGEQTAIGKAAAVAGTTIDTFRGAQAAFTGMTSTIPGPVGIGLGIAAAAAAVVSGLANVKKILAVKSGLPGEGSVSASGGSAAVPTAIATVNPEIGAGIVSRESNVSLPETTQAQQTVLVVDDVTAKQNTQSSQQVTATL